MRIAVIGGAGYIGSHIVLALKAAKHEAIVFDNLTSGTKKNIPNTVFVKGDIRDKNAITAFLKKYRFDAVIHLAALKAAGESMKDVRDFAEVNINGTITLLNAMVEANTKQLIFSSSAAVYGTPQHNPIDENHPTNPESFYGFTKLEIERLLTWYGRIHGIKAVSLRYFNAAGYDPRITVPEKDPTNLLPVIMEVLAKQRKELLVFGKDYPTPDGTCIRDYIHVSDLANAHVNAITYVKRKGSATFNLGTGKGHSVLACVKEAKKYGMVPVRVVARREGDAATVFCDVTRAKKELGWVAKHDLGSIIQSMARVYGITK